MLSCAIALLVASTVLVEAVPKEKIYFNSNELKNAILTFEPNPNNIIASISTRNFATREDRINQLVANLEGNAKTSQQSVQDFLSANSIPFTTIWISNQMSIKNMNASLQETLSTFNIVSIEEDAVIPLLDDFKAEPYQGRRDDSVVEWGIQRVRAKEALYLINSLGLVPAEVRVGVIDTGVSYTHETLFDKYYGTYGWFDPYGLTEIPNDYNGHGTHCTGTILGTKGIGVAGPFATWMGCKGCDTNTCAVTALLLCGQYITCPTLPDMSESDCTHAPHIVSNSWGGGPGQKWYQVVINAWHVAGIIPVFAAGNNGTYGCGTANSPGDLNVISVGATTVNDSIAWFSSRGPTQDGEMKPDVSAPGQEIVSASAFSDTGYAIYSGTSMACPHVAGVVAILKSIDINLTYEQVKGLLEGGVDTETLLIENNVCGSIPDSQFPNHIFGHGRVNVFKSASALLFQTGGPTTTTQRATTITPRATTSGDPMLVKACPIILFASCICVLLQTLTLL